MVLASLQAKQILKIRSLMTYLGQCHARGFDPPAHAYDMAALVHECSS